MSEEKQKLNIYISPDIAVKIKIESVKRGMTQGEFIAELWQIYEQSQTQPQSIEDPHAAREINKSITAEMERKKKEEEEARKKRHRIEKANAIINEWENTDIDLIELYAARMEAAQEKALAKELKRLADIKRRIL